MQIGDMVIYTLTESDAADIERRRRDWAANGIGRMQPTGFQAHEGNTPFPGQEYPMMITRIWETSGLVNGQVFLDGNDVLWVTSIEKGEGPRRFRER